jgi:hypothetical protein
MVVFVCCVVEGRGIVEWLSLFGLVAVEDEWLYGCVCLVCLFVGKCIRMVVFVEVVGDGGGIVEWCVCLVYWRW